MSAPSPEWERFWSDCKDVDLMDVWARLGSPSKLRHCGAEWVGPCPECGGSDRFSVAPRKGVWNCRGSEGGRDAVSLVMHVTDMSNVEAAEFILDRDRPGGKREETDQERAEREARVAQRRQAAELRRVRDEKEAAAKRRRDQEACDAILSRAVKIDGTHGEAYLRARGLTPSRRMMGDLRFVAEVDYFGAPKPFLKDQDHEHLATLPAIVSIIRDVAGQPVAIHLTYLDPHEPKKWTAPWEVEVEKKARLNPAKKIRKIADTWSGGMIRLGLVGDKLAIAEGIETALSWYALGYGPEDISLACAVDMDNLLGGCSGTIPHPEKRKPDGSPYRIANGEPAPEKPGVILPEWVREVIILGDGDSDPWQMQAKVLGQVRRWRAQGRIVSVHMAPPRMDFNDVLMAQQADAARAEAERLAAVA